MASGPIHRSARFCYRYRFVLYIAALIVGVQCLVAWSFLSIDSQERDIIEFGREKRGGGRSPKEQVKDHAYPSANQNQDNEVPVKVLPNSNLPTLSIHAEKGGKNSKGANNNKSSIPKRTRKIQRKRENQQGELNAINDRTKLQRGGAGAPVDQETDNSNHLANSAHVQNPNQPVVGSDNPKDALGKHYRSTMVRITPTGNVTMTLDYVAKCPIEARDAISALSRAKTAQCKQEIADIVCQEQKAPLFPTQLPRYCPLEGKATTQIENDAIYKYADTSSIRIVYVLVVHGRALRQVRRLIKLLYHKNHYFYIHVDVRSDYLHRELSKISSTYPNMRMTPWRMATIWGGASLLKVYLQCMQDLIAMEDWKWDFFINLSESDMPIRTNELLVSFLSRFRKHNFLKSHGRDDNSSRIRRNASEPLDLFIKKQGLDKTFYECDTHMWRLGERVLPTGISLDGGSDWIIVNRDFVRYLITTDNALLRGLKEMYKYTLLPAESFFHTVLENSELCKTYVDNNLRITNWRRKLGCQCQYKHIVDWCGCSPNDFKPEDFYKVKQTPRPAFFARKFEAIINQRIINDVDRWLYGYYDAEDVSSSNSYWQNCYHKEDTVTKTSDGIMTIYQSFIRLIAAHINWRAQTDKLAADCHYQVKASPHEVNYFMQNDEFQGVIVKVLGKTPSGQTDAMEAWLASSKLFQIISAVGPASRLQTFQVGTEFDPKERVFRNFARIMGPEDEPCVFLRWSTGEQYFITLTWIDPTDHIAGSFDTTVDRDREETHHTPPFTKPLRPGRWTVKMLYQWMVVAEVHFLVVPLALKDLKPISIEDSELLNSGPANNNYVNKDFSSMKTLFQLADSSQLIKDADKKASNKGEHLHAWIDDWVEQFWSVLGFCVTSPKKASESRTGCSSFKLCETQAWSTYYHDAKSELGPVKPDGRIR
ncbi:xylosyltransferase 1-like isoform X1 [Amphiura filiformis]|uniref:xylosyltransferase 1-like isoform X1 n=1 Tax=Amphiura filiformis TaxID=82378 RepID=UPI003B211203